MARLWLMAGLLAAHVGLTGCAVALGAGAAVVTDEALEQERGGDGLF